MTKGGSFTFDGTGKKCNMVICQADEWKGYGKQSYDWNEYRLAGDNACISKCHRQKFFDRHEGIRNIHEKQTIPECRMDRMSVQSPSLCGAGLFH